MTSWEWILVLLLIVVAAWLYWNIRRREDADLSSRYVRNIPQEYLQGLNYVLNEQQDKAIEVFIRMLEVDSDTVETHLALGNLFRRRGEVDRAIRIHQNLIARPTLSDEQRSLALLELALDYMRSGLLDRAENLFKELANIGAYAVQANAELLAIYQQEKDWNMAISVARRLQSLTGEDCSRVIAQFHCELAEESAARGDARETRDNTRKALNIDPGCVRASILEAHAAEDEGRTKVALKCYKRIEKQDPDYLPEVIGPIMECYRALDKLEDCRKYLQELVKNHAGFTPMLYLSQLIEETSGKQAAITFISDELRQRPTVRGVDKLLEYVLEMADGQIRDNLQTIKEMTDKLQKDNPLYRCNQCGFDAKLLHWQCPSCKQWSSIKPVFGVAGE